MIKKGLCINCLYDTMCAFVRKFPVLECEEFAVEAGAKKKKKGKKVNERC